MVHNPIICALDTADLKNAFTIAFMLEGKIGAVKIGLESFTSAGSKAVNQLEKKNIPVFLDLKFHDIPNTVAGAVRGSLQTMSPFMMTIHASGGFKMMQVAKEAAKDSGKSTLIVGVTVLTSMDENDLNSVGVVGKVSDHVLRLATLAQKAGLDGVVCSPHEIEILRKQCGKDFKLVVPGIRPEGSASGDQKRVMTPKEAIEKGADYLVIGRPITEAKDPAQAARDILASL